MVLLKVDLKSTPAAIFFSFGDVIQMSTFWKIFHRVDPDFFHGASPPTSSHFETRGGEDDGPPGRILKGATSSPGLSP